MGRRQRSRRVLEAIGAAGDLLVVALDVTDPSRVGSAVDAGQSWTVSNVASHDVGRGAHLLATAECFRG